MTHPSKVVWLVLSAAAFLLLPPRAAAQSSSAAQAAGQITEPETVIALEVTADDGVAAGAATGHRVRTYGALRPEGGRHPSTLLVKDGSGSLAKAHNLTNNLTPLTAQPVFYFGPGITPPGLPSPGFYPDDMYQFTPPGPVVTRAQTHNVYVNCTADCWGTPTTFQKNLFKSEFIHVVDQYVGSTGNRRYTLGTSASVTYPVSAPLNDSSDIASIVHAAGVKFGTGYGHIQNIFLQKGVDVCTAPSLCYSPDNSATWGTCSYHGYFDFPDIGHALYAVIPYQDDFAVINGTPFYACDVGQPDPTTNTAATPNGVLVDSTSHVISHEMLETITDPDYDAWESLSFDSFNTFFFLPGEIGDVCTNLSYLYTPFEVAGKLYYIEPAYSNKYHLCTTIP